MLRLTLNFVVFLSACKQSLSKDSKNQNFEFLRDFTCAIVEDEHKNHPEMRSIALIELENNFPSSFSSDILKCMPENLAKVLIQPNIGFHKNITFMLPQSTIVIYIADKVKKVS